MMTVEAGGASPGFDLVGQDELKRNWGWFLALGVLLVLIGAVAVGSAAVMTLVSIVLFGWLLIVGGVIEAVHGFWRKRWGGFFVDLLMGVLYVVVGFMVVANPSASAVALTLLIAMFLLFGGLFRIVAAISIRGPNCGWLLLGGVVSLLLGISIWRHWPWSGLWVIGLFIGIDMLFNGWSLIMLGLAAKNLPAPAAAESGPE